MKLHDHEALSHCCHLFINTSYHLSADWSRASNRWFSGITYY